MKLLIASDLHGSLPRTEQVLELARAHRPDALVLLGDLLYHGPRNPVPEGYAPREVAGLLNGWAPRIIAVRGNCDADVDTMILRFPLPEAAWIFADGLRIWASHGQRQQLPDRLPDLVPGDVFLCGHTHIPRAETVDGLHVWNVGSTTLPKEGYAASYGLFEAGTLSIRDMDGAELLRHTPGA